MKKDNRLLLLGVIGIITIFCIILYNLDFEKSIETPSPTPTRTVSIPTSTLVPTLTATLNPSPTVTNTVTPTETPKPTATPSAVPSPTAKVTHTSTPIVLVVKTGYDPGWLHFRLGPSLSYPPLDYLLEGTQVEFVECADTEYPWALIKFGELLGYSYSKYLSNNICWENYEK